MAVLQRAPAYASDEFLPLSLATGAPRLWSPRQRRLLFQAFSSRGLQLHLRPSPACAVESLQARPLGSSSAWTATATLA